MHSGKIVILGAGISGLSAAWFLKQKGCDVLVLEKENRAGGVMQSHQEAGYLCEKGPNTVILSKADIRSIIHQLDLSEEMVLPAAAAKKRFILRNKKLLRIPSGPPGFLFSRSLSFVGKIRALGELFKPPLPKGKDETVADFATRRFGKEVYKNYINPFVAGIYAGDPTQLSTRYGFKLLYELEQEDKSVIRGFIRRAKNRKKAGEKQSIFTFKQGISKLTETLAKELSAQIIYEAEVQSVSAGDSAYHITYRKAGKTQTVEATKLISTLPAYVLSGIVSALHPDIVKALDQILYVPLCTIHLGYKKEQIGEQAQGFGLLSPEHENAIILGALFNSRIFPHVAPEGRELFTLMIGGARKPELTNIPFEELWKMVKKEFHDLMKIEGEPEWIHHNIHPRAIPQYSMDYENILKQIRDFEKEYPGFFIGGNIVHGISVPDCVEHGRILAEKVV